ncbi:MAG TPA: hypothetical protein VKV39_01125 [Candidatus Sulfotelmatobacter sp.]|nr:hypothetical protein [Candidatus Sulfotelmatobacter sp.]
MQWKQNDRGVFVPDTPFRYGGTPQGLARLRKVLGSRYLLAQERRQVSSGVQKVPTDLSPWDLNNLDQHVTGRKEESVRVLLAVAFLRKFGLVDRDAAVGYKGAQFQRGKGSTDYPAAHRFPCNPTINHWGLPHYAQSQRLRHALRLPLEKTDYLPKLVNYADRLFEGNGACDAVSQAVEFVLHEQATEKEVNLKMIRHAALSILFAGYATALQDALTVATSDPGIAAIDPSLLQHVNQTWFSSPASDGGTAESSIEVVQFALAHALQLGNSSGEPVMLAPSAMTQYLARLEALHKAG